MNEERRELLLVLGLLLSVRLVLLLLGLSTLPADRAGTGLGNDATRFQQIATHPGTAYRDFQVEFPPVTYGAIELIHGITSRATAIRLAWSQFALDLAIALLIGLGWGRRTAQTYLMLGIPMAFFLYFRIDLLSVALAVAAVVLVRRRADRLGGLALAAAVLAKIWPFVLLPVFAVQRRWRALWWSIGGLTAGGLLWVWWAGWDAPLQVLTFRHARGWEVESLVGSVLWAVFREPAAMQSGAYRVGTAPLLARAFLVLLALAVIGATWALVSRRRSQAEGTGALTAVSLILLPSAVLSHQYMSWLLPWSAVSDEPLLQRLTFFVGMSATGVILSTALAGPVGSWLGVALLFLRNAFLVAIAILGLRRLRTAPTEAAAIAPEGTE